MVLDLVVLALVLELVVIELVVLALVLDLVVVLERVVLALVVLVLGQKFSKNLSMYLLAKKKAGIVDLAKQHLDEIDIQADGAQPHVRSEISFSVFSSSFY